MGKDWNERRRGAAKRERITGRFIGLPWDVSDCAAYIRLSHPAKAMLIELARQYVGDNNGRFLTSRAYLSARGWNSSDVISRAVRELEGAGFIHQLVQGHRPNKASWWAATWWHLDPHPSYDSAAAKLFKRGAYRDAEITALRPPGGVERSAIAPSRGLEGLSPVPSGGAVMGEIEVRSAPSGGHHLEKPSAAASLQAGRRTA
jgi:hypothetical protein